MIEVIAETGSTNADLLARLAAGDYLAEGYWLIADRQTAGRGRQGRHWSDGHGNFMGSTVVRPAPGDPSAATLALLAGLALAETVSALLSPPHRCELKWPNDLLIGKAKLSGILLEASGDAVIIGIGVNLASAPLVDNRHTVALSEFGPAPDRDSFARALVASFAEELRRWRHNGLDPLLRRWALLAHPVGTPMSVHGAGGEVITGVFAGLTAGGALQLRQADDTTRIVHAGEVSLDPANGKDRHAAGH